MAIFLSVLFFFMALFFISLANGFLAAFFLILSAVAFMNHTGGNGPGPDRYA